MQRQNFYWLDFAILLGTLILCLLGIGSYGLYEPHEGHFAMVGQEMLWRNDWITPHLNGSPYLNKPPLLYWSIATVISIFGSSEFSARLPVAVAGWLGIVIAGKWTRELWGINASRNCCLMLSVTLGWFIFTHQILIDVLLGTLLLSGNYCFWRLLYRPYSWIDWLGFYGSLALCILAKGIIGIVLLLTGSLALIIVRQDWKIIKRIRLYRGLLLVISLFLPWFIAVERANPGFLHYFVINEHFNRLLDRRFPLDYEVSKIGTLGYLAITLCWCLPWSLFLPSVVKSSWQEWRRGFCQTTSIEERQNSDGIFLLAIATIVPVIMFLPFSSRLMYYGLPVIPPYVILCAGWWSQRKRRLSFLQQKPIFIYRPIGEKNNDSSMGILHQKFSLRITKSDLQNYSSICYGAIAIVLGILFYSVIGLFPFVINLLPATIVTTEVINLILIVAIALGTGWLISGVGFWEKSDWALIPLFIGLIITYSAIVRGFALYQDLRSSKNLVARANLCLNDDTVWIFEGSREIGAAGAIAYYLNRDGIAKPSDYRTIMVLADGGPNRLPPQFPGEPPGYLITRSQLQQSWNSDRPTVFLTDFLRQPDNIQDPLSRNLPQQAIEPYLVNGQRKLYLNRTASQIASRKCTQTISNK
ncbi:MAG: glycosyltransferase family 39 protein [Pleurocapsa sp. MO_192.B19]|nr:glycosyltransferase family 39 protein [Pleurocapsa sp. MO_192.B19]